MLNDINKKTYKIFISVIIFCSLLVICGCSTTPKSALPTAQTQLTDLCQKYDIKWQWDSISQVVTLRNQNLTASVLVGSDVVLVGEDKVVLSAPVTRTNNVILVPPDFDEKIISRLKSGVVSRPAHIRQWKRVVIDAGHGGKDPGTIGQSGLQEKEVVLDISKRVESILKNHGFQVTMTRISDRFISLEQRTEIATRAKADLFVSIHANANHSRSVHGLEVYSLRESSRKELDIAQLKQNQKILFRELSMKKNSEDLEKILLDMLETYRLAESAALADHTTVEMVKDVGMKNRGHMRSGFFVLRNNLIPAILIETGYLSNSREERLFKTSSYRQQLAESIAKSIISYVGQ
jgi:N-acetylmuramoyl-L-alanine amidase